VGAAAAGQAQPPLSRSIRTQVSAAVFEDGITVVPPPSLPSTLLSLIFIVTLPDFHPQQVGGCRSPCLHNSPLLSVAVASHSTAWLMLCCLMATSCTRPALEWGLRNHGEGGGGTIQYSTIHDGGTSLGSLRVALACEPRGPIPYSLYHTLHIRWAIEITLCQVRYPITPRGGGPLQTCTSTVVWYCPPQSVLCRVRGSEPVVAVRGCVLCVCVCCVLCVLCVCCCAWLYVVCAQPACWGACGLHR
jgi:hypothetical protein